MERPERGCRLSDRDDGPAAALAEPPRARVAGVDAVMELLVITIVVALVFDFTNGFHDTANAVATSISTRALSPRTAILIAAVANLAGAFVTTAVAKTVG